MTIEESQLLTKLNKINEEIRAISTRIDSLESKINTTVEGNRKKDNLINEALNAVQQAEKADESFDFSLAYRLFIQAYFEYEKLRDIKQANISLVRAVTCLEKLQDWRGHSALWELLGNRLGNMIDCNYEFPNSSGQSGMYHIISWEEWIRPQNGYYCNDVEAERRNQQAWAYMWGAQGLEAEHRYSRASKLFRKAAIGWELSKWGDRNPDQTDGIWKKEHLEKCFGNKWKDAAKCYFLAAYNTIQDRGKNIYDTYLISPYKPNQIGWESKNSFQSKEETYEKAGDIGRMIRCWRNYGNAKNNLVEALEECRKDISILQNQLAIMGRRKDAAILHKEREKLKLDIDKISALNFLVHLKMFIHSKTTPFVFYIKSNFGISYCLRFVDTNITSKIYAKSKLWADFFQWIYYQVTKISRHWVYYQLTEGGTSLKRTFLSVTILYILIFPFIYLSFGLLKHNDTSISINLIDAIIFSLANTVSITIDNYAIAKNNFVASIVQTLNALSAYFILGYFIWLMTRSFED